jgi:hypothetical protein
MRLLTMEIWLVMVWAVLECWTGVLPVRALMVAAFCFGVCTPSVTRWAEGR